MSGIFHDHEFGAGSATILVVDDDRDLAETLAETLRLEFEVLAVTAPEAALAALERQDLAVLIADQQMPGMDGVALLAEARRRRPDVVGLMLTAHADLDTALQAINTARAFAFLTKPWDADELLVIVRRAVEAHRALRRQRDNLLMLWQRELQTLQELSRSTPTPVTAQRFGDGPLRDRVPDLFEELTRRYVEVLDNAFEQRNYRVEHRVSENLVLLADRLSTLRAGPRDVMELHTVVMPRRLQRASLEEAEAFAEEGRMLVLELMGHLVSCYRAYTLGVSR